MLAAVTETRPLRRSSGSARPDHQRDLDRQAYCVPATAKVVGLADGNSREAFSTKGLYIKVCLEGLTASQVLNVGISLFQTLNGTQCSLSCQRS